MPQPPIPGGDSGGGGSSGSEGGSDGSSGEVGTAPGGDETLGAPPPPSSSGGDGSYQTGDVIDGDGEQRDRCGFLIVRAGLQIGDWRAAEQAWPVGREHLGPDERPERLAHMALLAAKDGELEAALQFWQMKSNYDRGDMDGVLELAEAPAMAERLREWYEQLVEQDPACGALDRLVETLKHGNERGRR